MSLHSNFILIMLFDHNLFLLDIASLIRNNMCVHIYLHIQWLCKALTGTFNFANSTNFFWMFVEGLYLHIIIVWTYSADKIRLWYLIVIGWGKSGITRLK